MDYKQFEEAVKSFYEECASLEGMSLEDWWQDDIGYWMEGVNDKL